MRRHVSVLFRTSTGSASYHQGHHCFVRLSAPSQGLPARFRSGKLRTPSAERCQPPATCRRCQRTRRRCPSSTSRWCSAVRNPAGVYIRSRSSTRRCYFLAPPTANLRRFAMPSCLFPPYRLPPDFERGSLSRAPSR